MKMSNGLEGARFNLWFNRLWQENLYCAKDIVIQPASLSVIQVHGHTWFNIRAGLPTRQRPPGSPKAPRITPYQLVVRNLRNCTFISEFALLKHNINLDRFRRGPVSKFSVSCLHRSTVWREIMMLPCIVQVNRAPWQVSMILFDTVQFELLVLLLLLIIIIISTLYCLYCFYATAVIWQLWLDSLFIKYNQRINYDVLL